MKKLTAGIFTALLGLVTVNAANAAIPSTNYVDTKIGAVETAYQAADTALGNRITTNANAIGAVGSLTTTEKTNTVGAINEINTAYKAADEALDGRVDTLETKVGSGTMTVSGAAQTDVIAAINALDTKTEGIASSENLKTLENTVKTHTTQITDLQTADTTNLQEAKNYADSLATNYDAAGAAATAETNAKAYADGLAGNYDTKGSAAAALEAAESYADSLASNYDAAGAAATAQENAATYTDGQIDALAATYETIANVSTAVQEAKDYADNAATQAGTDAKSYADEKLELKVDIAQGEGAANHVVITDATGNVTTSATIEQTQVNGLSDALAAKLPVTAANNADGKYVLTATALNGTITYAWEDISRDVTE